MRRKVSKKTVRNHMSIIFSKLGVTIRAQVMAGITFAGMALLD
jgi:DNA-binding CsgD family transcriptional regulator